MESCQAPVSDSLPPIYSRLQKSGEIRLLALQPRSSSDDIKCLMSSALITDSPRYEALSYMWGPKVTKLVRVNDRVLEVRENLWDALYHLRLPNETRVLWIDAICINQEDMDERNHQVTQMGKIYRRASKVVAWLGLADQSSTLVMQLLSNLERNFSTSDLGELRPGSTYTTPLAKFDFLTIPETGASNRKLEAMLKYFCREYWTRLWVLQEVKLAGELLLQCGHDLCNGTTMRDLFRLLHFADEDQVRPTVVDIHDKAPRGKDYLTYSILATVPAKLFSPLQKSDGNKTLLSLLALCLEFGASGCEETRDKIFGLHSLASSCCSEAVSIDYGLSCESLSDSLLQHELSMHDATGALERSQKLHRLLGVSPNSFNIYEASIYQSISTVANIAPKIFEIHVFFKAHVTYVSDQLSLYRHRDLQRLVLPTLEVIAASRKQEWLGESSRFPRITNQVDLVRPLRSDHCFGTELVYVPNYPPKYGNKYTIEELIRDKSTTDDGNVNFRKLLNNARKHVRGTPFEHCKLVLGEARSLADRRLCFVPNETSVGDLLCEGPRSDVIVILRQDKTLNRSFKVIGRGVRYYAHVMEPSIWARAQPLLSSWQFSDRSDPIITLRLDIPALQALTLASATPDL